MSNTSEPENNSDGISAPLSNSPSVVFEDGSLIAPAASGVKGVHLLEGVDSTMSDDDGKVITTLETPKSTKEKVIIHSQTIIKPARTPETAKSTNDLLAKMKSRLSKQVDLSVISTPKLHQIAGSHDSSGSIEIPTDLILGSDIPATPAATHATKEELEDHDLIAILEGDDVDITETATEIEVRVGGGDEDEQDVESEKKERERQIAMRQMANLPVLPKGRKPVRPANDWKGNKISAARASPAKRNTAKSDIRSPQTAPKSDPLEIVSTIPKTGNMEIKSPTTKPLLASSGQVTIKGQTTIKPVPRPIVIKTEPTDKGNSPSPTKKVMVPPSKPISVSKPLVQKPSISKPVPQKHPFVTTTLTHKSPSSSKIVTQKLPSSPIVLSIKPVAPKVNPPVPRPIPIPQVKQSNNDLISSLVSDWDDEPLIPKKEPISPVSSPPAPRVQPEPVAATFPMAPPPTTSEVPVKSSRVIKKKIIWDPDNPETHMSFASFVKSNRTKPLPESPKEETFTPPAPIRPPGTGIRRKRAESVAVHMIKDTPQFALPPPRKRARTPEPVSSKPPPVPVAPKNTARKKKSEVEKLLGDEGAINMLYDVECENSNKDLLKNSDLKVDSDDEDEKLMAKTKIITDAVIKQGHSPNDNNTHVPRMRQKRVPTPQQLSTSPAPPATTTSTTSRKSSSAQNGPSRKRKQTASGSDDWDYVYNSRKTCDDAMIIRRRSNSSYSSSTSPRRLSVDQPGSSSTGTPPVESQDKPNFEFIKPSNKTPHKSDDIRLDSSLVANMKGKLSKALGSKPAKDQLTNVASSPSAGTTPAIKQEKKLKVSPKVVSTEATTATSPATTTVRVEENGAGKSWESLLEKIAELKLQELNFKRCGNYMELTLAPKETKLKDVFTIELINELKTVLNMLKSDPNVKAVLMRSSGKHFCRGIDVSYLIQTNAEKRKTAAQVYSGHLRNFLQTMATFNKPIVAAIHGDLVGLGVTMLPLFDVVIAQDNTTFQTPYGILGHLPEAMKIFTKTKNIKPRAITDLLYLCRKVSANTALDYGLVSEVVNSEKFQDRAESITKKLASLSQQALKSMKANLRQELYATLDDQLTVEQKKLAQQWITTECQEKFKQFVNRGGEW
ncbi:nucleolar protein dao-5 isoform X2 [Armigeres subalbatus]|uniref:nucleolar protein dao-5 isoform X2 n=1 Tax=Armigeres subalbatus TaxID=124917 RepID=UPI002ED02197